MDANEIQTTNGHEWTRTKTTTADEHGYTQMALLRKVAVRFFKNLICVHLGQSAVESFLFPLFVSIRVHSRLILLFSQIGLDHFRVAADFVWRALGDVYPVI